MKQEDKELLLKDLCGRLPYGVKMNHIADNEHSPKTLIGIAKDMITLEGPGGYECVNVEHYKPYLFPMSSMTGDEVLEYISLKESIIDNDGISYHFETYESINWLIKNHFDYQGLIEKGLALDATGLNIYD